MTDITTRNEFQAAHVNTADSAQYILEQLAYGREVETVKVHCLIFLVESFTRQRFDLRFHDDDFVKTSSNLVKGETFGKAAAAYAATTDSPFLQQGQNLGGKPQRLTEAHRMIIDDIIYTYGNLNTMDVRERVTTDAYFTTTALHSTLTFEI